MEVVLSFGRNLKKRSQRQFLIVIFQQFIQLIIFIQIMEEFTERLRKMIHFLIFFLAFCAVIGRLIVITSLHILLLNTIRF